MSAAMASEITPKLSIGFEAYTLGDRSSALVGIGSKYLQFNLTYDFFLSPLLLSRFSVRPSHLSSFIFSISFSFFFFFFSSFLSLSKSRSGPLGSAFFYGIVSQLLLAVSVKLTRLLTRVAAFRYPEGYAHCDETWNPKGPATATTRPYRECA